MALRCSSVIPARADPLVPLTIATTRAIAPNGSAAQIAIFVIRVPADLFAGAVGCGFTEGGRLRLQCLQTIAASWISSAQYGHRLCEKPTSGIPGTPDSVGV
jgi:hypothetical protein